MVRDCALPVSDTTPLPCRLFIDSRNIAPARRHPAWRLTSCGVPSHKENDRPNRGGVPSRKENNRPNRGGVPSRKENDRPHRGGVPSRKENNRPNRDGVPSRKENNRPNRDGVPSRKENNRPYCQERRPASNPVVHIVTEHCSSCILQRSFRVELFLAKISIVDFVYSVLDVAKCNTHFAYRVLDVAKCNTHSVYNVLSRISRTLIPSTTFYREYLGRLFRLQRFPAEKPVVDIVWYVFPRRNRSLTSCGTFSRGETGR